MSPIRNDYLSCDNLTDAKRSLALFYGVEHRKISDLYDENWPEFLPADSAFSEFTNPVLVWCLSKHLGLTDFISPQFKAAFYHRTRFNGDSEWFSDGLLTAQDGLKSFFGKIEPFVGHKPWFACAYKVALANVKDRNEMEKTTGPHAYDHFYDAASGEGQKNYDVPEFCIGSIWADSSSKYIAEELRQYCITELKPVVVKFIAVPLCIDQYVMHLWFYLFKHRFQIEYCNPEIFSFSGGGQNVPSTQIVELITDF